MFTHLKNTLINTKLNLQNILETFFANKKVNNDVFEEIEDHLIMSDVSTASSSYIIKCIKQEILKLNLKNLQKETIHLILNKVLNELLINVSKPLIINKQSQPFIILLVGINGSGKTTTIGKIANIFSKQGKNIVIAAGDTFRVGAIDQLKQMSEIYGFEVISQHLGADSACVIYDTISSAKVNNVDIVIADTAGRLQNKRDLMLELKKIVNVIKKHNINYYEIMLILDSTLGQNSIIQAQEFNKAINVTGITLTKLDNTAKGGIIFSIAKDMKIPIRYFCTGKKINDINIFNSKNFINQLLS